MDEYDDGPYWAILLLYGSHDMGHTSFHRLTVVNGTPGFWGVTHLLFGSGFVFPSKWLSVSSKDFKSMAALTAAPAVGISETFDNLRKRGQVCGFLILVSLFSVLTFFFGCLFVICLDGRKMGEKNGGF